MIRWAFSFGAGMSRRTLIAAVIGVSVFAAVAYAMTWVELRAGVMSMSSGTRAE